MLKMTSQKSFWITLITFIVIVAIGWSSAYLIFKAVPFSEQIEKVGSAADGLEWEKTAHQEKKLKSMLTEKRWILQLVGDEAEYEGINRELSKLHAAVHEKDKTQVNLILADIHAYLKDLFTM